MTSSPPLRIAEVSDRGDFRAFLTFPWRVYRGNPFWVPPLLRVEKALLSPGKNPFWEHAERALFLAFRGEEPVGRIAAIADRDFIAYHRSATGYFGFFECRDDPEAASALFTAAESWLKARKLNAMIGPLNPSTNHTCGFLLEGYDSPPKFMMPYTLPYYHRLCAGGGLRKAKDLFAYRIPVPREMNPRLETLAGAIKARGAAIRRIDMKNFRRELGLVRQIYNEAWKDNWGFVPITEAEIAHMARELKPLVVPDLAFFAEYRGEPAGFYLVLPDYNQIIKKMDGRMGPRQLLTFFLQRKSITEIRLLMAGIVGKFQKKGLDALLYLESARTARDLGYRDSEISWLLEDNALVIRATEFMGGTLSKKYRIYEKKW